MSDEFSPITPKRVPLSHSAPERPSVAGRGASAITWALGVVLAAGLLVAVFVLLPDWLERSRQSAAAEPAENASVPAQAPGPAADAPTPGSDDGADALPPYQALEREQARERAQDQLAEFVELQMKLEESMQVGEWGNDRFDEAKTLAAAGDEAFVEERYQAAMDRYQQATDTLAALIEDGEALLEQALEDGAAALAARDRDRAEEAFALAATIAPDDPRVADGQARAGKLPRINELMRRGRNQELARDWAGAESTYAEVRDLEADTRGLEAAMDRVAEGRRQQRLQELLSEGFAHLDAQAFDAARAAFTEVLDLEADNAVAAGGLEQVDKQAEVARINALKAQAEQAVADERWEDAAARYAEVLEVDPSLQFARAGRATAQAQKRTRTALARIVQNPERLSSDKLYREAREILARAESLEPRGPRLASRIEDVRATLEAYAEPVPVVLRSDNRTEVTLSTVGELGSFAEKRLELRPGAYTVVGSRDGCRDVREQIVVRPDMNPVDIRCAETL